MFRRKLPTLGGWLLLTLSAFGLFLYWLLLSTTLLRQGVTTQGVITGVGTVNCGGKTSRWRQKFSVEFIDRTGQGYTSTISQCHYAGFNASPGDSVAIVYLPDNPTEIAPPDGLMSNVQNDLNGTILSGLITLILLPLWIRKRIRRASLQDQPEQHATVAEDATHQESTEEYRSRMDRDIIGGPTPGEP
jgi:Protein of unknown function (DUF3592)